MKEIQNQYQYEVDTEKHNLEFSRHSCIEAHKDRINAMQVERSRGYLYSIGNDKRLVVTDLNTKEILVYIKTANACMRAMCLD